jgi:hypothetical protein
MARRVIEGQIGMFDAGDVGPGIARATMTSSVSARSAETPSSKRSESFRAKGKAFGGRETPARVLTLAEIENLEPFKAVVWIEILDDGPGATTNPARAFLRLFQATFQTVGIPYKTERKHYHFKYTYTNGRNYYHWRIGEFYGQTWRVWDKKPTDAQREATPWLSTQ